MRLLLLATFLLFSASICRADEDTAPPHDAASATQSQGATAEPMSHPNPATHPHWASTLVMSIAGMFIAAILIGSLVRAKAPEEMPVTPSHDEPPGASGNHAGEHHGH